MHSAWKWYTSHQSTSTEQNPVIEPHLTAEEARKCHLALGARVRGQAAVWTARWFLPTLPCWFSLLHPQVSPHLPWNSNFRRWRVHSIRTEKWEHNKVSTLMGIVGLKFISMSGQMEGELEEKKVLGKIISLYCHFFPNLWPSEHSI